MESGNGFEQGTANNELIPPQERIRAEIGSGPGSQSALIAIEHLEAGSNPQAVQEYLGLESFDEKWVYLVANGALYQDDKNKSDIVPLIDKYFALTRRNESSE